MEQMTSFIQNEIVWFEGLEKAEQMGVAAFLFCCILTLVFLIRLIVKLIRKICKPELKIDFRLEDVVYQAFRKKSFVTFDLYVQNHGRFPFELVRAGLVMADGSEKTLYQETHVQKAPDKTSLNPGEEAYYDDCDLFLCLNERPPYYKKITGFFVDVKGYHRFTKTLDIPAIMNDQTVRAALTDSKGANGF